MDWCLFVVDDVGNEVLGGGVWCVVGWMVILVLIHELSKLVLFIIIKRKRRNLMFGDQLQYLYYIAKQNTLN